MKTEIEIWIFKLARLQRAACLGEGSCKDGQLRQLVKQKPPKKSLINERRWLKKLFRLLVGTMKLLTKLKDFISGKLALKAWVDTDSYGCRERAPTENFLCFQMAFENLAALWTFYDFYLEELQRLPQRLLLALQGNQAFNLC